ncbi:MAG TPA: hypothetical protein VNM90_21350, partial [Haliangium sp.]|nr:hypothetical protein [Haliangium sp.]
MTRTAKRGISNAAAMAACAVCLVAAAVIVMVPVLALAHRQADQPPPFHAAVDRVSSDAAWDAARVSDVALADDFSQWSPARAGQLADIVQAGRLDAGSLRGVHVPADARRDACTDLAADAARDRLVAVRSCPGQADVVLGHSVAGPVHPFRRVAVPWMRVAHADGHAAVIPAVGAEWHGSVSSTRLARPPVDAFGQSLPVDSIIRSQVQPTSLLAHGEFRALAAGHLRNGAAQLTAAACANDSDSARGPSPSPATWTPEVNDHIRFHFRGLFTYCVSARFLKAPQRLYS